MRHNKNLVSIIIPVYNCEEFLEETIHSAINQTWPETEILIVDDGSTDNSVAVAKKFESDHCKIIKQPNKGACAARNHGFKESKGAYIQFLDGDDLLSSDKIETQVKILQRHEGKVAVCNTWLFSKNIEESNCTDKDYLFDTHKPEIFFINLWGGKIDGAPNMIQTNAWLMPRELIVQAGLWDETLARDQDGEFFARTVLQSQGIIYTPKVKNFYRKHRKGDNVSSIVRRKSIESMLRAADLKAGYLLSKTQSDRANLAIATQYRWVAFCAWPVWKDITAMALKKSEEYGGSTHNWILGNKGVELLKSLFGWKFVKFITHYYVHFKRKYFPTS